MGHDGIATVGPLSPNSRRNSDVLTLTLWIGPFANLTTPGIPLARQREHHTDAKFERAPWIARLSAIVETRLYHQRGDRSNRIPQNLADQHREDVPPSGYHLKIAEPLDDAED